MTIERAVLVRVPGDAEGIALLVGDIRSAQRRVAKALPGDRVDIIRYEALSTQLERTAARRLLLPGSDHLDIAVADRAGDGFFDAQSADRLPSDAGPARSWIAAGDFVVELRAPFEPGPTPWIDKADAVLREPALTWSAPLDSRGRELEGPAAVAERFRQQLQAATDGEPESAMMPSGVANRVLTETLRSFVNQDGSAAREIDVHYRDGSVAPRFPIRCLALRNYIPTGWRTLHFSMLSIRHTEMDVEVDGAWLRNTDISRPRSAGDTDRIAYDFSTRQLTQLCADDPVLLYLYQTGLDAALVGVYRAVTRQLIATPTRLVVVPMFFRRSATGTSGRPSVAGYEQQSRFAKGQAWAV